MGGGGDYLLWPSKVFSTLQTALVLKSVPYAVKSYSKDQHAYKAKNRHNNFTLNK